MIKVKEFTITENWIEFFVEGTTKDVSPDGLNDVWREIANTCLDHSVLKALVHWNVTGLIPMSRAYNAVSQAETAFDWDRRIRLAVIHLEQTPEAKKLYEFVETISFNNGYQYKSFIPGSDEEAQTWLN
jgi:hypothetical protein